MLNVKKSEYFEKLCNYAKKMFGVSLREVWIHKCRSEEGLRYYSLEITVEMPPDILKKYIPQLEEYFENKVKKHNLDIRANIKPYRNLWVRAIPEVGKSECLYQRGAYLEIKDFIPTKSNGI